MPAVIKMPPKLVLLKTAWCDRYEGDPAVGNFEYIQKHGEKSGAERFNFRLNDDGLYYGYCPPIGETYASPNPPDPTGWTVVWVAKKPRTNGVRIVGVYFDATFVGTQRSTRIEGDEVIYCVTASRAFLVPPELRTKAFPSPIKSAPCLYLTGGNKDAQRKKLSKYIWNEVERLQEAVAEEPTLLPSKQFAPRQEHIRAVEKAAVDFVRQQYEKQGFCITSRERDCVGYDLDATKKRMHLRLEVKGTAGSVPYAYITKNELGASRTHDDWRMCMVVNALTRPALEVFDAEEFKRQFELEPLTWRATRKVRS